MLNSNLLFHSFSTSGISESFCKRIVIYFQLGDLFVLICGHGDELTLLEDVGSKCGVWKLKNITGAYQVEPRLVLVHRVKNCLQKG